MRRHAPWPLGLLLLLPAALAAGSAARAQDGPITYIKVAEVNALLQRGVRVHLIDVRSRQEYLARHIKGAVSIPLNVIEDRAAEVPRQGLVVLY